MFSRVNMACHVYEELLLRSLNEFLSRNRCNCIALSGGIDTSIIAIIAKNAGIDLKGYTVLFRGGIPRDVIYVDRISKYFGIDLLYLIIDENYIREVVKEIYSCIANEVHHELCIELRNDVVFYTVLSKAKEDGCRCIYVGSGGDEVFAGYNFMVWSVESVLEDYRTRYSSHGRYPELIIGRCIGMEIIAPYLSREVLDVAMRIPTSCLRSYTMDGKGVLRGILRLLGMELIAERVKTPAEAGAGTDSICINP